LYSKSSSSYFQIGYKVTAAIDLSGIFRFVSAAIPGANHDIECFRQQKVEFEKTISKRDQIVGDAAYQSLEREASVGKWHIKRKAAKNRPLSKEDEKRNSEIEVIRRHIEKSFGYVKQIFGILRENYRCRREWLSPIVLFCFGVSNLKKIYNTKRELLPNEWDGPIPQNGSIKSSKKKVNMQAESNCFVLFLQVI